MANPEFENATSQLTAEAIAASRQRERLHLIRRYLIVSLLAIVATFLGQVNSLNNLATAMITLVSASLYVAMLLLLNQARLGVITIVAGVSSTAAVLGGMHLTGGFGGPNATIVGVLLVAFLVLYEGRTFLYACAALLVAYLIQAGLEASGLLPATQNLDADAVRYVAGTNVVITIVFGGAFLFWYISRYVNASHDSLAQARQLARLNQQFIAQQQLQNQTASAVTTSVQRIGEAIGVQAQSAQETAATVAQVSSSAEQLDLEAKLIAGSAQQVSELIGQANTEIQASEQLIEQVEVAVQLVHSDVTVAVERTTQLGEHVREITTILQLLEGITKETHILSLNAAIEAASAEDTMVGRRFAVVAQEVEELASRAERATSQVRIIINQVGQAANATALATVESMGETERSVKMLQQATETAKRLSAMVADINIWADSILQSTIQQEQSSEQVAAALQQIANLARQNAASEQQLQAVARQLTALAGQLQLDNAGRPDIINSDTTNPPPPTSARPTTRLQVAG